MTHEDSGKGESPSVRKQPVREPEGIPNYELVQFIAQGGFGDVWLARERLTGVRRAIKIIYKADASRAAMEIEGVKKYQRRTQDHPSLLQILTVGETEDCFFYVMEAADELTSEPGGRYQPLTLRRWMEGHERIGGRKALEMIRPIIEGIAALHHQDLVHYDIKPENILLFKGTPKFADVGLLAGHDDLPPRAGTPAYMPSPSKGDDIFALGKILYELISGYPPDRFPLLPPQILHRRTAELSALIRIANKACHPDRNKTFRCIADMDRAVTQAIHAKRSVLRRVLRRWRRMSRSGRIAAFTAAAAILASAILLLYWLS